VTPRPGRARGREGRVDARATRSRRGSRRRRLALLAGLALAGGAQAACLVLASSPDGQPLARIDAGPPPSAFAIAYVHSVTRTPVEERYRVDGSAIVETEIRFEQHGPGLPTEADAGGAWRREGGRFAVAMDRRFATIAMRVHADQSPVLAVDGAQRRLNLAQWGNRSLALSAHSGACPAPPSVAGRAGS
jgi:hypothetical protein